MKVLVFVCCLTLVSAALYALDLPSLARRERARRSAVSAVSAVSGRSARSFNDDDLERVRRLRAPASTTVTVPAGPPPAAAPPRDLARERVYWRKEAQQHIREVARVEASMRRLEWRLNEKRARKRNRDWITEDPSIALLEDSIRSLSEERNRLQERFRERARTEGALPGWIR